MNEYTWLPVVKSSNCQAAESSKLQTTLIISSPLLEFTWVHSQLLPVLLTQQR